MICMRSLGLFFEMNSLSVTTFLIGTSFRNKSSKLSIKIIIVIKNSNVYTIVVKSKKMYLNLLTIKSG